MQTQNKLTCSRCKSEFSPAPAPKGGKTVNLSHCPKCRKELLEAKGVSIPTRQATRNGELLLQQTNYLKKTKAIARRENGVIKTHSYANREPSLDEADALQDVAKIFLKKYIPSKGKPANFFNFMLPKARVNLNRKYRWQKIGSIDDPLTTDSESLVTVAETIADPKSQYNMLEMELVSLLETIELQQGYTGYDLTRAISDGWKCQEIAREMKISNAKVTRFKQIVRQRLVELGYRLYMN